MRSIKPGRGPSAMGAMGSGFAIVFGIFWTIMAASMVSGAGIIGVIFPIFGLFFIGMGVVQLIYNVKNATGENRMSLYDITEDGEESDPFGDYVKHKADPSMVKREREASPIREDADQEDKDFKFCPYCGEKLKEAYSFCPSCGRGL